MPNTESMQKVELKVGPYDENGTFLGEVVRFSAEEIGFWSDGGHDATRYTEYTVYRTPDNRYRVMAEYITRWQGESSSVTLYHNSHQHGPNEEPRYYYGEEGYGDPVEFGTYSEEEARAIFPQVFAAIGKPNVRDLD